MSEYELLGLGRAVFAVVALVFALRGRYWLLSATAVFGLLVSLLVAAGVSPLTTSKVAYGFYGCLAWHTLDISRRIHPKRANRRGSR